MTEILSLLIVLYQDRDIFIAARITKALTGSLVLRNRQIDRQIDRLLNAESAIKLLFVTSILSSSLAVHSNSRYLCD